MYKLLLPFILNKMCPEITPMLNFNTTEYIRNFWYIQQQQITGYQPNNTLYCVTQTLEPSTELYHFFW